MSKMDDSDDNLIQLIKQYQNSIIKHSQLGNDEKIYDEIGACELNIGNVLEVSLEGQEGVEQVISTYMGKLYDMPITVSHLQETGIGRTVNALRKYNGSVGGLAKTIVNKWKNMVALEEDNAHRASEIDQLPTSTSSGTPERKRMRDDSESAISSSKRNDSSDRSLSSQDEDTSRHKSHKSDRRSHSHRSDSHRSDNHRSDNHNSSKSDSNRSSHSRSERSSEHRSHSSSSSSRHRSEETSRKDRKRKREREDKSSKSSRKHYETDDSDAIEPDSSCNNDMEEETYEDTQLEDSDHRYSPIREPSPKPSPKPKKHHKSDKHRKHDSERRKDKHMNGSEKKSHHKESKHSSEKSKKDKSDSKRSKSPVENGKNHSKPKESTSSKKSSSSSSKVISPSKVKKDLLIENDNGIDSGSGASFAEALGMMQPSSTSRSAKKKNTPNTTSVTTTTTVSNTKSTKSSKSTPSTSSQNPDLLAPNVKLEPLEINIATQLPEITTNYRPLNNYNPDASPLGFHRPNMTEEEALSVVISSKTQRTKVYSGVKTNWGYVPTLFNLCVKVLQDNIDSLEYTGGVPYIILKPVLERASADQLLNAEYHNPYLVEESDELWELHCKRECRGMQRQEMESWRDMYLRCRDERDAKLRALTVNIRQSIQDKTAPIRQTKLAYVDTVAKPPRGIARKQAKYGTEAVSKPILTPTARLNSIASGSHNTSTNNSSEKISVPNPGARAATSSGAAIKPKKAPLMQKTLALIKSRFRR